MSYIFSRALVEAYLEASCSDSAPFALSNLNPIPQAYCSPDRMTAYSRLSRFGMTYAPLTDDRGAALLTWYLEASRARTFQPQEKAPALTAPAPASGGKCTELSMRYDRNSHSWKTHLCLWDEDLPESSVILPKSGTMRNGLCWERTMWEPRTSESASGYLHMIPTPTACNAPNKGSHSRGPKSLMDVATTGWMPGMMWPTATTKGLDGGSNSRHAARSRGMWPTPPPRRQDGGGKPGVMAGPICSRKSINSAAGAGREIPKSPFLGSQETWPKQQATGIVRICPDVSYSNRQLRRQGKQPGNREEIDNCGFTVSNAPHQGDVRRKWGFSENESPGNSRHHQQRGTQANDCGEWWSAEPDVGRVAHGVAARVDRLKAIGNGQVPAVAATAFRVLLGRFQEGKEGK